MQTPLDLGDKLLSATAQQQRTRLGALAVLEDVEPLPANLPFLKLATRAKVLVLDIGTRRLDRPSDGLRDALQIIVRHPPGAKDIPIGKVLRREVPDGQP